MYMIMCWGMELVPRHMNDCNEQVDMVNATPGEKSLSWYTRGPYSVYGSCVKLL